MYKIRLTIIAADTIKKLDSRTRNQIINKIESLKEEPLLLGKPLKGPLREFRSIRAGGQEYRIIYKVLEKEIIVIVVAIGIRKEGDEKDIYELMKKYIKTGLLDA
ncbi:MAG: type II toxin-antitoxin system RelE/ParE family toxin [Spirochaetes bacterium]|nr:type II toxin-antitoxin system RelE/ParE family toxin [Spirochaetota bacterium]